MQTLSVDGAFDLIGHFYFDQKVYFVVLGIIQLFLAHHLILSAYTGLEAPFTCIPKNKTLHPKELENACPDNDVQHCLIKFNGSYTSMQQEWNLVCNEKYKLALVQSVFMFGVMMGALILGGLADRIGRLKTLMISLIGVIVFEGFSAFSSSLNILISLRFIGGVFCALLILSSFVLSQELVGSSYRGFMGTLGGIFFSLGIILLSIIAANVGDWRTLTILTSLGGLVLLMIPCFLPESPRWLLIQEREPEAREVMQQISKRNGTLEKLPLHWQLGSTQPKSDTKQGIRDIFSHAYLFKLTVIQIYAWFVTSCVYYALTMAASNTKTGNVYVSTSLNGLVEIPAVLITTYIIDRIGRKTPIITFMMFGGSACVAIPIVGPYYPGSVLILGLLGKLSITAVFACIYVHAAEIYPTIIRNTGMGVVSVAARVGGMTAPFILMLNDVKPYMHFLLLGILMCVAGILYRQLPKTINRPMPETVADVILLANQSPQQISSTSGYSKLLEDDDEETIYINEGP